MKNYGVEAKAARCLRGTIVKGERTHTETTRYTNMHHYVECYAVVDNIVIARSKVIVPIVSGGTRNSSFILIRRTLVPTGYRLLIKSTFIFFLSINRRKPVLNPQYIFDSGNISSGNIGDRSV